MNEHKNVVGCVSGSIKKAEQDTEKYRFYSLCWPTEKQSTLAGLSTSRCMKKGTIHNNTSEECDQKPRWMSPEVLQKSRSGHRKYLFLKYLLAN